MGMVKTVGLVLHPGRNCNSAMLTILKWASDRKVTVLGLEGEADRIPTPVDAVSAAVVVVSPGAVVVVEPGVVVVVV